MVGCRSSPVTLQQLSSLSTEQLFRLLDYYNDYQGHSDHPADRSKGGRDMVARVLGEAAALDPMGYLDLVPQVESFGLQSGYLTSLLGGIADHLRYRFGRLQPPENWQPIQPEPNGPGLARRLLNLMEGHSELWGDGQVIARMLETCCGVLDDSDSAERIVFLLFRLLKDADPEKNEQVFLGQGKEGITADDLRNIAINSVRGIAAGGAIRLCNRLLEQEKEPPELLFPLLRHCARDSVQAVRAALLENLAYLTYKRPSWGRQLVNDIFREPQTHLWPLAEPYLYHQYHEHFGDIARFLRRMQIEAPEEAGEAWGRLAALALLSEHIDQDALFDQLETMDSIDALKGATQVFAANLEDPIKGKSCINGLRRILRLGGKSARLLDTVEGAFDPKHQGRHLDEGFASCFFDAIKLDDKCPDLDEFFKWIGDLASRTPVGALTVCEQLVDMLSNLETPHQIWRADPLISALTSILREADETDEESLIRRAVHLQDQFLRMGIPGINEFFEKAGRIE